MLSVRLKSVDFAEEDIAPTSLTYDANLSLAFHLEQLTPISIKLSGTMVDITPELEVQRELQFGSVYLQQAKQISFTIKNPARRTLQWKLVVESNYEDIFSVTGDSDVLLCSFKAYWQLISRTQ